MTEQVFQYNNPETSDRRAAVVPPTLDEMNRIVGFLTECVRQHSGWPALAVDIDLVQRFIWNYENLDHYHTVNYSQAIAAQELERPGPFARLFYVDSGAQVLVTLDYDADNPDGEYLITMRTETEDATLCMVYGYKTEEEQKTMYATCSRDKSQEWYDKVVGTLKAPHQED